jgi:hypothetical protein
MGSSALSVQLQTKAPNSLIPVNNLTIWMLFGNVSNPSKSEVVIDRNCDVLLRTKISFRRLDRGVTKEKFDLLQVATVLAA